MNSLLPKLPLFLQLKLFKLLVDVRSVSVVSLLAHDLPAIVVVSLVEQVSKLLVNHHDLAVVQAEGLAVDQPLDGG